MMMDFDEDIAQLMEASALLEAPPTEEEEGAVPPVDQLQATPSLDYITVSWQKPKGQVTGYHLMCASKSDPGAVAKEVSKRGTCV